MRIGTVRERDIRISTGSRWLFRSAFG